MTTHNDVNDLSLTHELVGDTFSSLGENDSGERWKLSEAQVEQYAAEGFLAGVKLLDDTQVQTLRSELAELTDPKAEHSDLWYEYNFNESTDPDRVLFHALGAWRIKPSFHDILWNPAFVVAASQLLGGPVRFWHDQLFCKPAKHGGVVAWHQDYSYWTRTTPIAHLTCWIALDDATPENGSIHYIPGSHHWDLLPTTALGGDMSAIRAELDDAQWEQFQSPHGIEIKAGECSFHHPLTLHGSFENSTDRPRRAVVLNVVRDGVHSASDEPLLSGVDVIQPGRPLAGRFFPLLYSG